MIWDDPWVAAATNRDQPATERYATLLPPPMHTLPAELRFRVIDGRPSPEWTRFVRTRWTIAEAAQRLAGAHVAIIEHTGKGLVATCVLRRQKPGDIWLLETLRAQHGYGRHLMRTTIRWLWDTYGPYILTYTWELSLPQLLAAWWRGWLKSAVSVQYGWALQPNRQNDECVFCPGWKPLRKGRHVLPLFVAAEGWSVVCLDSGLGDDIGYILAYTGEPDWAAVCAKGGWGGIWMRRTLPPAGNGWWWTGEFIVIGALNTANIADIQDEWITAEIA